MLGRAPLMRLNALGTLPPLFRKNATAHMEPGSTGTPQGIAYPAAVTRFVAFRTAAT